jgi:CubicO group peptidase (beta-lactamase class C family)
MKLLNSEQNSEVCDATKSNRITTAGFKKSNNFKLSSQYSIQNKIPVTMSYKVSAICLKVLSIAAFLLQLQPVKAQYNWGELDAELQAKQKLLGTNVVVMIWSKGTPSGKSDSLVYKKEMGDFNSKTQAPIASCSKWLTAALVMQFVDEGKISLDDKVVKYLPFLEKYFKSYITIRQCLSQMTGIEDGGGTLKKLVQRKKFDTLEEEVEAFAARDIRANPGTDFWYGSIGLNIAGRVLEVVSKKKFDILIKTKLLNPLAMRKTSFSNQDGAINPSGGAVSTADDYMHFLMMLLNKGKYNGVQVLSENSVNEMLKVQTNASQIKYAPKSASGFNYASGSWVLEDSPLPSSPQGGRVATTLASPGLFGTWPMIDFCRGYAYIVFVKSLLGEEKADAHLEIKQIIDKQISSACQ